MSMYTYIMKVLEDYYSNLGYYYCFWDLITYLVVF